MEAEYVALSDAAKEALWLKKLFLDADLKTKIEINEDNQSTIKTSQDVIRSDRSKHIDTRYHFIRDRISKKEFLITYCPTQDMVADIFTKPLPRATFQKHVTNLGLRVATEIDTHVPVTETYQA
jgi:KUP system potassium uptake protein